MAPTTHAFTALFGETLTAKDGKSVPVSKALDNKVVGVYFSAHWCPPCRGFTPKLAQIYKDVKAKHPNFEIVFASSDRDEAAFNEYYAEMPWLALPFSERTLKEKLSKKFKVSGIPSFVILDEEGKTITTEGRTAVSEDPQGEDFPWKPKPFAELLGDSFIKPGGEKVGKEALQGKTLGIYFSAHWCPPCRGFTPELVKTYKALQEQGQPFEIIFVSSDRDQASFDEYHGEMPWLAIPHGDKRKGALSNLFGVSGIPSLAIVDAEGNVINANGRGALGADPTGAKFPWHPEPVCDVEESTDGLNEETCVIAMMEGLDDSGQEEVEAFMKPMATKRKAAFKAGQKEDDMCFFTAKQAGGITSQLRKLMQLPATPEPDQASLVILDIPDNGGYYKSDATEITEEVVQKFIADYEAGKLERQQLARG